MTGSPAPPRGHTTSMREVAEAAGVSISTVSRALAGADSISGDVRRRVADVARELGYDRRGRGTASRPGVFLAIGLDLFTGDAGGFYRTILDAIEDELDRLGAPMETQLLGAAASQNELAPPAHADRMGALLVGLDRPALLAHAAQCFGAVLLVNGRDPAMRIDGVAPANRRGSRLAVGHLLDMGHRRIAHLTALRRDTIRARREGWRDAHEARNLAVDEALVVDVPHLAPEAAARAVRKGMVPRDATAIFCGNDMVAAGAIAALAEAGLSVPNDVSVVGFDDTRLTARIRPGLTTVAIDQGEIGRRSVARLMERLRAPDLPQIDVEVGCRLVERDSTRPPKAD